MGDTVYKAKINRLYIIKPGVRLVVDHYLQLRVGAYFNKVFKKETGHSPRQYRAMAGESVKQVFPDLFPRRF